MQDHKKYYRENREAITARRRKRMQERLATEPGYRGYLNNRANDWRRQNQHRLTLKRFHGMSLEEYKARLLAQGGLCAICKKSFPQLHVDHDHSNGKIRGLLCGNCNRGIGLFFDKPENLLSAVDYLGR